ncbi:MAG: hypothetical protein LBJ88_01175 [Campylobacteraceae bacterium]|nr:hypothetical protein [Campylobacteraceae bacterium]
MEKNKKHFLFFDNFEGMYVGTPDMRFLSIKSGERVRIRVGTGGYAPYSKKEDIDTMDRFVKNLETALIKEGVEVKRPKKKTNNGIICYQFIKK